MIDKEVFEKARLSRDPRFDGKFFTGVTSTGIFCRPICPAPSPKSKNVVYFLTAAAAMDAGLRPCLRCRPESAPGSPVWKGVSATLERALVYIKDGYLNQHSVKELAEILGLGDRHLRRLFKEKLGCSPQTVALTERLFLAKKLLMESSLPISQIALASGFASIRRFNDAFKKIYSKSPRDFRIESDVEAKNEIQLYIPYREPFNFEELLSFFRFRAIEGLETVGDNFYERSFEISDMRGIFKVHDDPMKKSLLLTINANNCNHLYILTKKVRKMFDMDLDLNLITEHLMKENYLRQIMEKYGLQRLPGAWDSFEFAVRAILGQVVSVKAATRFCQKIVTRYGKPLNGFRQNYLLFPDAASLLGKDFHEFGLTKMKNNTLKSLVSCINTNKVNLNHYSDLNSFIKKLNEIKGVGDWTSNYIAMRGMSEPDAFPYNDLGVIKALRNYKENITEKDINKLAQQWQPWRSYATMLLWKSLEGEN